MKYKSIIAAALIGTSFVTTGCKDDFAEVNTKPSVVNTPDIRYLFTKTLAEVEPSKYQQWFYNNTKYYLPWTQATVLSGGNGPSLNQMGEYEGQHAQVINIKVRVEEIKFALKEYYTPDQAATYENIRVLCNPLLVYMGLFGTDVYGSMPYSEAGMALHSNPVLLTPKYETQAELFDTWLAQLNETIDVLGQDLPNQVALKGQDFVYGGDWAKWRKFANSLKLKIAVRLLHADKAKALKIAEEVVNSPAGIMAATADDFLFNKAANDYHFGDNVSMGVAAQNLTEFLVTNRDPRLRSLFKKNDFNARVVQAFLDNNKALPPYIAQYVKTKTVEGKPVFDGWSGPGEPWVRYFGAPVNVHAREDVTTNQAYFDTNQFKLKVKDAEKTYQPLAVLNQEMIRGQIDFTYPDAPNAEVNQDTQDVPWTGLFFSAAETNYYLAELGLLGANLPQTPEYYFEQGVRLSVAAYDNLAKVNKIPYYDNMLLDGYEKTIALQPGEIDALLQQSAYQLTGSTAEKLEKVYIQQYIHFLYSPDDLFACVRRSGIPQRGSAVLAWDDFTANGDAGFPIPRRFQISVPLESDLMYSIKKQAYEQQGFSLSTFEPSLLNTERVWYDKGAPDFGEGPNF